MRGGMREILRLPNLSPQETTGNTGRNKKADGPLFGAICFVSTTFCELLLRREIEQVHQIADRWTVRRNVRVAAGGDWIREIIPAAGGQRR